MTFLLSLLFLVAICTVARADIFVPPAKSCLPSAHLKELSGCIAMTDKEEECGGKGSDKEKLDCYCTQEMLSSIYDCENDIRICLETHMFDSQFDLKIAQWHSICDTRITTSMTTPSASTLTTTYDFFACGHLQQSCVSGEYETKKCSETHLPTSSLSYTSCVCQPPIYSLFSECQYNGNISCKRTTAHESNIMGYSYCSYFWSGSKTLSSIDLTSFLSMRGQLAKTQAPPRATNLPGVESSLWTTRIKPAPAGTTIIVAQTARHVVNKELK